VRKVLHQLRRLRDAIRYQENQPGHRPSPVFFHPGDSRAAGQGKRGTIGPDRRKAISHSPQMAESPALHLLWRSGRMPYLSKPAPALPDVSIQVLRGQAERDEIKSLPVPLETLRQKGVHARIESIRKNTGQLPQVCAELELARRNAGRIPGKMPRKAAKTGNFLHTHLNLR
jgi:hypothetical protein